MEVDTVMLPGACVFGIDMLSNWRIVMDVLGDLVAFIRSRDGGRNHRKVWRFWIDWCWTRLWITDTPCTPRVYDCNCEGEKGTHNVRTSNVGYHLHTSIITSA